MLIQLLTLLVILSAAVHIRAEYRGHRRYVYIFKPLTTILVLLIALAIKPPVSAFYQYMIGAGLVFSLSGDIFLMLPKDRFIAGLVSFLVAHLCYIAAFTFTGDFIISFVNFVPFFFLGGFIFWILRPNLGNLKLPVFVYILVILVMAWQASNRWLGTEQTSSLWAFIGALFFVASDSMLAIDRFKMPFQKARFYVLTTYITAQWFIALSVASV